jgi:FkbM family methyltransferase
MHLRSNVRSIVRASVPRAVRNTLRSPSRLAEWLWDSARFSLGFKESLSVLPDWPIACHPRAHRSYYQAQVADKAQREEFVSFVSHCSKQMFLFDIGACFGIFSLAAAHFGGRAIAVDPSPTATRMIEIQIALNGLASRVRVIRGAASDTNGLIDMLNSGVFSCGFFQVAKDRPKREMTRVNAVTIDHMVREFGAPTHIKVDVEGHEHAVIRGARATLRGSSPILFLELHNRLVASEGLNPSAILDELAQLGYVTFGTDGKLISRRTILETPISYVVAKPCSTSPTSVV